MEGIRYFEKVTRTVQSQLEFLFICGISRPASEPVKAPTPDFKSQADITLSPTPGKTPSPMPWKHVEAPLAAAAPAEPPRQAPTTPIQIKSVVTTPPPPPAQISPKPAAPSPEISRPEPVRPTQTTLQLAKPTPKFAPPAESDLSKYIKETDRYKGLCLVHYVYICYIYTCIDVIILYSCSMYLHLKPHIPP